MRDVDVELAAISRSIDPVLLGRRLRDARVAAGLTQTELADGKASTAYVSRIEAGQRRPDFRLLGALAERAGTSLEKLLGGLNTDQRGEVRLELDYAELELRSGAAAQALDRLTAVTDRLEQLRDDSLATEARLITARALEGCGRLDDAITALEDLVARGDGDGFWLRASISLTRCYRDSGDLARATAVGDTALARAEEWGLGGSDEAILLAVTTASAYFERGDVRHAVRMCRRASDGAEEMGSRRAKASAYWNASIMESVQGRVQAAIPLARHAVELMEAANEHLSTALLHTNLGAFMLALDPPETDQAIAILTQAQAELEWSEAGPAERGENELSLARARFLTGETEEAQRILQETLAAIGDSAPLLRARGLVLAGQIAFDRGEVGRARDHYGEAIYALTGAGADRRAAQVWFELGVLLDDIGDPAGARDSYRRAAASTGLTTPRINAKVTRPIA